ncbi:hypothetical protein OEZ85_005529 [Tetradesmus obliquus]|uniref:Uncharacterized protein n=1 Tax=Tetradesmus obliquus TaxID=3088 RepID=A0ABY8UE83_TETOB|nr:hypothetical protein OEZ85_005529 [Tetradesmus obliquus]
MKRALFVLALCLCALPAMQARSLSEEELLESTALLLQSSSALTSDEQMMLGGGFYGASPTGTYGGLFDDWGNQLNQEAAASSPSSMTTTTPAPAPVQTKAASSAMPADKSMAMLVAGAMVAVSALLL